MNQFNIFKMTGIRTIIPDFSLECFIESSPIIKYLSQYKQYGDKVIFNNLMHCFQMATA